MTKPNEPRRDFCKDCEEVNTDVPRYLNDQRVFCKIRQRWVNKYDRPCGRFSRNTKEIDEQFIPDHLID